MATGETLVTFGPLSYSAADPSENPGVLWRNGHPALIYRVDGSGVSYVFNGLLPSHYSGGGLTVTIHWTATVATSGAVRWSAQIERMSTDTDADSFAAAQSASTTTDGTSGNIATSSISFTSGSQMDSLAAGESFRLKITRNNGHADDTLGDDAELRLVEIRET